jgi:hypothetical protein
MKKIIHSLVFGFDENVFKEIVVVLLHLLIANVCQVRPVGRFGRVLESEKELDPFDLPTKT